jgi:MscS family membrane protein
LGWPKNLLMVSFMLRLVILLIIFFITIPVHAVTSSDLLLNADASPAAAITPSAPIDTNTTPTDLVVLDDYNRGTPRSAIQHFLDTIRVDNYSDAIHYLDFNLVDRSIQAMPREEVAKLLKLVLDRSLWIDLPALSNDQAGFVDDGLSGNRDLVGYIPLKDQRIPFYVQRIAREDGVLIWKIAGISINYIPKLYTQYGDGPIGEILTQFIPHKSILGLQLWQWITFFGLIIAALFLAWLPTKLIVWLIKKRNFEIEQQLVDIISGPIRVLLVILLFRGGGTLLLSPSLGLVKIMSGYTLLIIAAIWSTLATLNILRDFFVNKLIANDRKAAAKLLNPLTTAVKIIFVVTAVLVWLDNLGFEASTILAGLGIGGLAVALAAQKSIENVIGGVTLYISAPIKVGNLGKFGKYVGFVEDIGMRYTKIRTLDRTLVNISNSVFVDMKIENYSERNRIRFSPELVLSHQSSPQQIEAVITDIKQLLDDHELICEIPCRVRFSGYLEHGIALNVMSYVDSTKFPVYADVSNELNLAILYVLGKHEVKLADLNLANILTAGGVKGPTL